MLYNLKRLRERDRVTQAQLAGAIGVSQQSINKYENHDIQPDIETLIAIADFFSTSVDELVGHICLDAEASGLKADELALLRKYRSLTEREKESVHLIMDNYNQK